MKILSTQIKASYDRMASQRDIKKCLMVTRLGVALSLLTLLNSCQTTKTGGKIVDLSKGEIILTSAGDQVTALPSVTLDKSLTDTKQNLVEAAQKNPNDIQTLLSLAQLQLVHDEYGDAEDTCQKVLRLDIKNSEAKKILAQIAIRQGNHDLAMIFLNALGGYETRDSGVMNMLGLVAMAQGDASQAMALWKKTLALNANELSARMNLGVLYLKYRVIGQASAQFERILKTAPNHQDARLHLAIIEGTKGNHEQAMVTYRELASADKNNPIILFNMAVSQQALQQYDDALDSLKVYIKASSTKSKETDTAFAMIEEIHQAKQAKGESISADEIARLADETAKKPAQATTKDRSRTSMKTAEADLPAATGPSQASPSTPKTSSTKNKQDAPSDLGADQNIEDLEKELRAH